MAHDADNVIAFRKAVVGSDHAAEQLVAEDQPFMVARRLAVLAFDDFAIRAAHAERNRLDQQRAFRSGRLRHIAQFDRVRLWRTYGDSAQGKSPGKSAAQEI